MTKKNKKNKILSEGQYAMIKAKLRDLFENNWGRAYSLKQLMKKIGLRDSKSNKALTEILNTLESEGKIGRLRNGNFRGQQSTQVVIGVLDQVSSRLGYVTTDLSEQDIRVTGYDLKDAFHRDTVKVMITGKSKRGDRLKGKIIEIVKRNRTEFVGRIEILPRYSQVVPDFKKIHTNFFIAVGDEGGANHNEKVIIKIKEWRVGQTPQAKVVKVLGVAGENETEIHSIMAEFGLPFSFTSKVLKEVEKIPEEIGPAEVNNRRDFRTIDTFTIDPIDAKDFDDALSLKLLNNGNYEIGIHIADVSHYVKPESLLEHEAIERGTSVYLVDRTIPMLPEKLSNGVCSLKPNEDKLTYSAVFEINDRAKILNQWFGRTIIHSNRRFNYDEVQQIIESAEGDFANEVIILNQLAAKLRKRRFEQGAINFETVEVKFDLDKNGKPLGIVTKVRKEAHKLVEEFMLLANRVVANFIYQGSSANAQNKISQQKERVFVYRTHDSPDGEKLANFSMFARRFGHEINLGTGNVAANLNQLMSEIEGKPEQNVLESLAIRSMAKAKYTTETKGHFGLAFAHYTHFTSPIRRYPDVMVHRLLQHYLEGGKSINKEANEEKCVHSSEMEKRAADAERASIKYKQVEFMQLMEKKEFEGLVSGVTEWGIFVEIIETKCEGMVRLTDLWDDFYEYDEKNFCVVGKKTKKTITLGDSVKVRVKKTDIDRRTIDLDFVDV